MNTKTNCMGRHGGQPEGVKGQKAVAPDFLDTLFHQRQAQLKSTPSAVIRAESSRPLFTGLDAKDNKQRIADYEEAMARYTGVKAA